MKTINQATPEDVKQIRYLVNLKHCNHYQAKQIESYLQQFVDASCSVCSRCPSQVRFAHSRLKSFYLSKETELTSIESAIEYKEAEETKSTEKKVGDVLKGETTEVQAKPKKEKENNTLPSKQGKKPGRPPGAKNKKK